MADVRTFEPATGDGLQKLVREALGQTIRPVVPGSGDAAAPRDDVEPMTAADLPAQAGETIPFDW